MIRELAPRERQIAALVAQGKSNAEIGALLNLSRRTIGHRLSRYIYRKLGIHSRTELAIWWEKSKGGGSP